MRYRSWHRRYALPLIVCALVLLVSPAAAAAPDLYGPTRATREKLSQKRYIAAGWW